MPEWSLFDACVELARKSWQADSESGTTLCHEQVEPFFRETHELAARMGMLDLNLLKLNGRPVAYCYNYHHDGYVYGMRTGYDPEFAHLGVGALIYHEQFRDSVARRDHTFDLGPEYLKMKRPWFNRIARSYRYTHYSLRTPRVQVLRLKHWATDRWSRQSVTRSRTTCVESATV